MATKKPDKPIKLSVLEKFVFALNGISTEAATQTPEHERNKLTSWGLTICSPPLFGGLAAGFIASTMTDNRAVMIAAGIVWAMVILSIDRAILSSFRATAGRWQKVSQVGLRFAMATVIGVSISHPLVLHFFSDSVEVQLAVRHQAQLEGERTRLTQELTETDGAIERAQESLTGLRGQIGQALTPLEIPAVSPADESTGGGDSRIDQIDRQIEAQSRERENIRAEITQWEAKLKDEIAGSGLSGKAGYGTEAKRIEAQELTWRRESLRQITAAVNVLQQRKTDVIALNSTEDPERVALLTAKMKAQTASLEQVISGRQVLATSINTQITTIAADVEALRTRRAALMDQRARLEDSEPASDIIAQTLSLHSLFHEEGGWVALAVYALMTSLFLCVDLLPLSKLVASKPSAYDFVIAKLEAECQARHAIDTATPPAESPLQPAGDPISPDDHSNPMKAAKAFDALPAGEQKAFSRPKASKWRKLLAASRSFQRVLAQDVESISLENAYRLACLNDPEQQMDLLCAYADGEVSSAQLSWRIEAAKSA